MIPLCLLLLVLPLFQYTWIHSLNLHLSIFHINWCRLYIYTLGISRLYPFTVRLYTTTLWPSTNLLINHMKRLLSWNACFLYRSFFVPVWGALPNLRYRHIMLSNRCNLIWWINKLGIRKILGLLVLWLWFVAVRRCGCMMLLWYLLCLGRLLWILILLDYIWRSWDGR